MPSNASHSASATSSQKSSSPSLPEKAREHALVLVATGWRAGIDPEGVRVGVAHHVGFVHRRDHEIPEGVLGIVDDAMGALLAGGEGDVRTRDEVVVLAVEAQRAGSREHVQRLLVSRVVVIGPRPLAGREFVEATTDVLARRCSPELLAPEAGVVGTDSAPLDVGFVDWHRADGRVPDS